MALKDMYAWAVKVAQGKFHGTIEEHGGKLYFNGTVATEAEKNQIWDAIKTIPTWQKEITADIRVTGGPGASAPSPAAPGPSAPAAGPAPQAKSYTVKAGDTLSKIAREFLGDASAYMKIFEANRDQLSDPNQIRPGQVLHIPS